MRLDDVLKIESTGDFRMTCNFDRPGSWLEVLRIIVRVIFGRTEFVIIIIGGNVVETIGLFGCALFAGDDA